MYLYGRYFTETEIIIGAVSMGLLSLLFAWAAISALIKGDLKASALTGAMLCLTGVGLIQYMSYWR
jgi:hypothetical protein